MSILERLTNPSQGSQLTAYNGRTPNLVASSKQSKLHGTADGKDGYSTSGAYRTEVNADIQAYLDGALSILPQPSQLDPGVNPTKYLDNPPR